MGVSEDPTVEAAFNVEFFDLISRLDYTVITVVIDKLEHRDRYKVWRYDPYHYCVMVLMERYVQWLEENKVKGDVLVEARGGKADIRLKDSFERLMGTGSSYVEATRFQEQLTTGQLKMKPKKNNIAGLQLADLIAHPSYKATLMRKSHQSLPDNFGGKIAQILERRKYRRSPEGTVWGWGRVWLP